MKTKQLINLLFANNGEKELAYLIMMFVKMHMELNI